MQLYIVKMKLQRKFNPEESMSKNYMIFQMKNGNNLETDFHLHLKNKSYLEEVDFP